ncbi:MAG: hypothetical protein EP338_13885 [Bacteroidetes bacterium]|nr:MAG: hypothetical protein EP338_13885 [Bacteroidota bacterium]
MTKATPTLLSYFQLPLIFVFTGCLFFSSCNSKSEKRFLGSITIPCIDSIEIHLFQGTEQFEQFQGINYFFRNKSDQESEWFCLGGTDDFDGASLDDFHIECQDSIVQISYNSGGLVDKYPIQKIIHLTNTKN